MKRLIVIPAFNEAENLTELLPKLQKVLTADWADVLVVDDRSSDQTIDVVRDNNQLYLSLAVQLGAWGATQAGIRYAQAHNYQQVITMDADGQHLPEELTKLLARKNADNNVVIGTYTKRLSRLKRLAWRFFKILTLIKIQDLTSGFRLYDQAAIDILAAKEASLLDYQDVGVLLLLLRSGMVIDEVEVKMMERNDGKSRVFNSWPVVFKYMMQTTTLCVANFGRKVRK